MCSKLNGFDISYIDSGRGTFNWQWSGDYINISLYIKRQACMYLCVCLSVLGWFSAADPCGFWTTHFQQHCAADFCGWLSLKIMAASFQLSGGRLPLFSRLISDLCTVLCECMCECGCATDFHLSAVDRQTDAHTHSAVYFFPPNEVRSTWALVTS